MTDPDRAAPLTPERERVIRDSQAVMVRIGAVPTAVGDLLAALDHARSAAATARADFARELLALYDARAGDAPGAELEAMWRRCREVAGE